MERGLASAHREATHPLGAGLFEDTVCSVLIWSCGARLGGGDLGRTPAGAGTRERHANPREVKYVWWLGTLVLVGQAWRCRSLGGRDFAPDLTEASVSQPDVAPLLPGLHHLSSWSVLAMFCGSFPMSQVLTSNSLHNGPCCLYPPQQEVSLPLGGHCPRWTLRVPSG